MRIINYSYGSDVIHLDGIAGGLLDRQHQGICLGKDLIFDLTRNLEPFTAIFDNFVVYRDFAGAADEVQSGSRSFEAVLDALVIGLYTRKGEERSIVPVYVEASISA